MRDLRKLDHLRILPSQDPKAYGHFRLRDMLIVASTDNGWDHVSVSLKNRTPLWKEMSEVHRLFFLEHEVAMQLHVPLTDHVNFHAHCLHLWRPQFPNPPIPLPDPSLVL